MFAVLLLAACGCGSNRPLHVTVCSGTCFQYDGANCTARELIRRLQDDAKGKKSPCVYYALNSTNTAAEMSSAARCASMAGIWNTYLTVGEKRPERFIDMQEVQQSQAAITVVISDTGFAGEIDSLSALRSRLSPQPTNGLPYRVWIQCDMWNTPVERVYEIIAICNEVPWAEPCPMDIIRGK